LKFRLSCGVKRIENAIAVAPAIRDNILKQRVI